MPTVGEPIRPEPDPDPRLAEREEFVAGFKRSTRGNLWRQWDEKVLTVFKRGDAYSWCVAKEEFDKRYSPTTFGSEADALESLRSEMGIGY